MAKFAFLLPRDEMVGMAARIAEELGMEVVVNRLVHTAQVVDAAREARSLGADIIVARGRQASIIKESTDLPVAEIRLTGQEVALLLHRARLLVAQIPRPKIGVVTMPNMIGDIRHFDEVLGIEVHTYFVSGLDEMGPGAQRAIDDGMDIILGGDFVNEYCRRQGQLTLFFDSTEDSLRTGLRSARSAGFAADAERKNTARLQALLDYSFNGILELDGGGTILQANDMACKILDLEKSALVGVPLFSLMPAEDADLLGETLRTGHEMYFSVLTVAEVSIIANAAPVEAGGTAEGVVFSFYEMRKMERQGARALRERYRLHRYLAHGRFEDVHHTGPEMQRTVKLARAFAETMQPILLQGEVGGGKSLFAQSIHNSSPCSSGPFVAFSCSAGWENQGDALSALALDAANGTLYLDELDRLDAAGQFALHRLLEEGVIQRQGDECPTPVTVRVIASTARDFAAVMAEGNFRPDLYYVLAPMLLRLPPLHTLREDLDEAIDLCLDDCVTRLSRYVVLTKEARRVLLDYPWPGNYIQLRTFLERMVLTATSRTISDSYVRQLLDQIYPTPAPASVPVTTATDQIPEVQALIAALARNKGNRTGAAAELGISKTTLWRRMKQYGIYNWRTD